jgi:Flp pilus assembly protein TadG
MMVIAKLREFIRSNKGVAALWFGLTVPVIVSGVGLSVDVGQSYLTRERLSHALDAAALAAVNMPADDEDAIEQKVQDFIDANYPEGKVGFSTDIRIVNHDDTMYLEAWAELKPAFASVLGVNKVEVKVESEVTRVIGTNIELALVLDISGSMNSLNKINDLKTAAKSLIDTVVYDDQSEYYSKIAIVPYSMAVNAGSYATQVRGSVTAAKTITGATKANPVVVTSNGHGYNNGDRVYITGIRGMTQINNRVFTVAGKTTNTFQLSGVDGRNYSTYTNTGSLWCTTAGCQYYYFMNASSPSVAVTLPISTCVSERVGTNVYTDAPPSTTLVGRNYAATANPCLSNTIVPLSSDKTYLKNQIDGLVATGSTGGQVGVGWGWYMLAPNWGYLWPSASRPAAYGTEELHKIMVLMTDGEYNSPHCNGVISKDATSGSGNTADHINCNATNGGTAYTQSEHMCDAMKAAGKDIEIYTIGFRVNDYPRGEDLMEYCATDASHFFTADNGEELQEVFEKIARNVKSIYLSK